MILMYVSSYKSYIQIRNNLFFFFFQDAFWSYFSAGKQFAKRQSMWDAMFMGIRSMGRDEKYGGIWNENTHGKLTLLVWFTLFYLMSQSVSQSPQLFIFTYLCYLSSASTIKLLYWACHGPCHVCSRPLVHCEVVSAKSNCRCRILRVCFMCCIFFCDNISFCDIWCCSRRRLWCIKNSRRKLTDSTARKSWWSTTTTHAKSTTSRIVIFLLFSFTTFATNWKGQPSYSNTAALLLGLRK